jgi:hypothetical protein
MNKDLVLVVFKNISKASGKIYYTIKIKQIINGALIETSGFINEEDIEGLKLIDMTKKRK